MHRHTFPAESFTSLLKRRYNSKRNIWRSLPFLISCFGSHTVNESCSTTSPSASILTSQPSSRLKCKASLAFLGTFSITSNPSFISPCPSWQQFWKNYVSLFSLSLSLTLYNFTIYIFNSFKLKNIKKYILCYICTCKSLSSSWYFVILCTGLIRYAAIGCSTLCFLCNSSNHVPPCVIKNWWLSGLFLQ